MWFAESDALMEPSPMTTGICTMAVFDKFEWDDDDDRLNSIFIKSEPEDDSLSNRDDVNFNSLSHIFPELGDIPEKNAISHFDDLNSPTSSNFF
jgi:hypothetical protein